MARLGCKCGAEMTNTEAPSRHVVSIFYKSEAEVAIDHDPNIRLWDFYSGWDEKNGCNNSFQNRNELVEYWYCTECKRVSEVQAISCGRVLRTFAPDDNNDFEFQNLSQFRELIVLKDVDMDDLLSREENMGLKEYLDRKRAAKYYLSNDESVAYIVMNEGATVMKYTQETS